MGLDMGVLMTPGGGGGGIRYGSADDTWRGRRWDCLCLLPSPHLGLTTPTSTHLFDYSLTDVGGQPGLFLAVCLTDVLQASFGGQLQH